MNRKPLNRSVKPETIDRVKALAEFLDVSEGKVLDRAVAFLYASGKSREGYQVSEAAGPLATSTELESVAERVEPQDWTTGRNTIERTDMLRESIESRTPKFKGSPKFTGRVMREKGDETR